MVLKLIDVWDANTFDNELYALLERDTDLVRNYISTKNQIFLSYDHGRGWERASLIRPENPYGFAFVALEEAIGKQMLSRSIRAWHYTRLTDPEVDALRRDGIHLSTPASLRARLDALVAVGVLQAQVADSLYAKSPFHSDQMKARSNKFWMASHPIAIDDRGVEPLLARWGGEVASFWTKDPALLAPLAAMGRPCVLELAVPLALTRHSHSAGQAVVATFGRSLGCIPSKARL